MPTWRHPWHGSRWGPFLGSCCPNKSCTRHLSKDSYSRCQSDTTNIAQCSIGARPRLPHSQHWCSSRSRSSRCNRSAVWPLQWQCHPAAAPARHVHGDTWPRCGPAGWAAQPTPVSGATGAQPPVSGATGAQPTQPELGAPPQPLGAQPTIPAAACRHGAATWGGLGAGSEPNT